MSKKIQEFNCLNFFATHPSDPAKLAIAARLRRETTLTLPWIAARLQAGTWKSLNAKLYRWRKTNESLEKQSRL